MEDAESRPIVRTTRDAKGNVVEAQVEYRSMAAVQAAGIDAAAAWESKFTEEQNAAGEITFDPSRLVRIPARAGGVARLVRKVAGDRAQSGEVLAVIESADVGRAKAEFQQSLVLARLRQRTRDDFVRAKLASSQAAIREAEAAHQEAEVRLHAASQTLVNLGLPIVPTDYRDLTPQEVVQRIRLAGVEDVVTKGGTESAGGNLLPIRAALSGVVLSSDVVVGEVVDGGKPLFTIVDPSKVWITLHLPSQDAKRVAAGMAVVFRPDGFDREFPGTVLSVGTIADESTRTIPIRAEARNDEGQLRASTLGRGRVVLREADRTIVVPDEAVHSLDGKTIVFVRDPHFLKSSGAKLFQVRHVVTGGRSRGTTEVLSNLAPGEAVATKQSGLLLGELLRESQGRVTHP
ncbi:MAG: efflux RND transporter periplasmic adaptor subunit [Gemmataceae bacterium]